jgi:hypothetical protein
VNFSKVVQLIFYFIYDPFQKQQEMETNPKSLPSNLKPLKPYPSWFFYNWCSCLGAPHPPHPPKQTWRSSLIRVGPLASNTQAPKPVSYAKSGFEWIWSENMVKLTLIKMSI